MERRSVICLRLSLSVFLTADSICRCVCDDCWFQRAQSLFRDSHDDTCSGACCAALCPRGHHGTNTAAGRATQLGGHADRREADGSLSQGRSRVVSGVCRSSDRSGWVGMSEQLVCCELSPPLLLSAPPDPCCRLVDASRRLCSVLRLVSASDRVPSGARRCTPTATADPPPTSERPPSGPARADLQSASGGRFSIWPPSLRSSAPRHRTTPGRMHQRTTPQRRERGAAAIQPQPATRRSDHSESAALLRCCGFVGPLLSRVCCRVQRTAGTRGRGWHRSAATGVICSRTRRSSLGSCCSARRTPPAELRSHSPSLPAFPTPFSD